MYSRKILFGLFGFLFLVKIGNGTSITFIASGVSSPGDLDLASYLDGKAGPVVVSDAMETALPSGLELVFANETRNETSGEVFQTGATFSMDGDTGLAIDTPGGNDHPGVMVAFNPSGSSDVVREGFSITFNQAVAISAVSFNASIPGPNTSSTRLALTTGGLFDSGSLTEMIVFNIASNDSITIDSNHAKWLHNGPLIVQPGEKVYFGYGYDGNPSNKENGAEVDSITFSVLADPPPPPVPSDRPNFLFLATDDMKAIGGLFGETPGNFLQRLYPDPEDRAAICANFTPNIDRLANEGVAFMHAFCPSPVCNASRAAIMTGIRPHVSGLVENYSGIFFRDWQYKGEKTLANAVTLPQHLKNSGYYTATLGKIFHSTDRSRSDFPTSWNSWSAVWGSAGSNKRSPWSPSSLAWGQEGPDDASYTLMTDYKRAEAIAAVLENGGSDPEKRTDITLPEDKAFFLACGFKLPHLPYYATKGMLDLFDEKVNGIPMAITRELHDEFLQDMNDLPAKALAWSGATLDNNGDPVIDKDRFVDILTHGKAIGGQDGDLEGWKDMLVHYFACMAVVDRAVGRVLEGLANSPYKDNTIVVFWSDHGYHVGEKFHETKFTLWEDGSRVHMIFKDPRNPEVAGVRCHRPVNLIDMYPTICSLAGIDLPGDPRISGHDLKPLLNNPRATWHIPTHTTYGDIRHNSIRTNRYAYIRYFNNDDETELYDLDVDPEEFNNLVNDPAYDEIQAYHNTLLLTALAEGEFPAPNPIKMNLPEWRHAFFGISNGSGASSNLADPDGDGKHNLLEYGLLSNPIVARDEIDPISTVNKEDNSMTLTFPFRHVPGVIRGVVETSSDLNNWTPIWDSSLPGSVDSVAIEHMSDEEKLLRIGIPNTDSLRQSYWRILVSQESEEVRP